jgi:phosphoglycolate phosphatase-like HAD superfamily hydrolase
MFVVFDLDGTLAQIEHRLHFIDDSSSRKDWAGFHKACERDEPCGPVIAALEALMAAGHEVEIWSGRSDDAAEQTLTWLVAHGLGHVRFRLRPAADRRPDTELKAQWFDEASRKPDLVFEDRASVVAMWRSRGVICAQVAPGNF